MVIRLFSINTGEERAADLRAGRLDRLTAWYPGLGTGIFFSLVFHSSGLAATHEQIASKCREMAHPQVHACVMSRRGTGDIERIREACRASVGVPIVRACVQRQEQQQAARQPAPATPRDETANALLPAVPIQQGLVAPPRTIADIAAILDSEKPDAARIAERKVKADATPPIDVSPTELAQFYYDRGNARALLAREKDALADGLRALETGKGAIEYSQLVRVRQLVALRYLALGDPRKAVSMLDATVREGNQPGRRGSMINASATISNVLVSMGDVGQAGVYAGRVEALVQEARGSPNPNWRKSYSVYGNSWEADANRARAGVLEARGQYREAELAYRRAAAFRLAALNDNPKFQYPVPSEQILLSANTNLLGVARCEAKQGRLSEAEADARRALLAVLKTEGKYNPSTSGFIVGLANILVEQGRYQEAEKLARSGLDVQRTVGIGDDAPQSATILSHLGNILVLQRRMKDAAVVYAELDQATAQWNRQQRELFEFNGSRIVTLYSSGQLEVGITAAQELVKRQAGRSGEKSFDTAVARGILAVGYARAGRDADAIREFEAAIPVMMAAQRENAADEDTTLVAARNARLQRVVEAYIRLRSRPDGGTSSDVAIETFGLADAVRGQSVQRSLAASTARIVARDPSLAELVRREQDLARQVGAELGALNNLLALPSDQREEQTVRATNAAIAQLRAERDKASAEITRRFPAYADLLNPRPPSVAEIKAVLRPGEALLSFYFGQDASFVWAVPKDGAVAFAPVPVTALGLEAKVRRLREALEPHAITVEDIPDFDLALAYELYGLLLKPVEGGWKDARSLIVVTNGPLGVLPLALLPTAPAQIDARSKPLFGAYRNVAWLARTHAVTVVPSASALLALRRLPPGSLQRDELIGFGDPFFNEQEAAQADDQLREATSEIASIPVSESNGASVATRGIPLRLRASPHTEDVDSAELGMLPRLPDTREELLAIAQALRADPSKSLYLGKDANEQNVKTFDLTRFRIIAFATHGLVAGDLDGLTQPALALTAPGVAGINGDGLLTLEEILALRLDADWIVLSACNTAAGAGTGAEAASGLGSAFFYAGTRAVLVTNWSVHSASARELVSDLFRRQTADEKITRAEALRRAMIAVLDGRGFGDDKGGMLFSYAHPLFWAPYSLIGDGG